MQGYSNNSTWTRGQAWAIYGFTTAYLATGDAGFLTTATRAADLFLRRLPPDDVPPWDFNAPPSKPWKDTSAGAAAASGLLQLAAAAGDASYQEAALGILAALAGGYLGSSQGAPQPQLASILRAGTANVAEGSWNTGLIYGK